MRRLLYLLAPLTLVLAARAQCPDWSSEFGIPGEGITGRVFALATFDDGHGPSLYAAGRFTDAGSSGAWNLARWDGAHWRALNPAPVFSSSYDLILDLEVIQEASGPALYACGDFQMTGVGTPMLRSVARFDGTHWSSTNFGSWSDVTTVHDDGTGGGPKLFIANTTGLGYFDIGRYEGNGTWDWPHTISGDRVSSMASADLGNGPRLYAGTSNGAILIYRPQSLIGWTDLPGFPNEVEALVAFDDGNGMALFAGGRRGHSPNMIAFVSRWDGTTWNDIGGTMSAGGVDALGVHDFGNGPQLVAAGTFTSIGGISANRIAVWDGSTWAPLGAGLGPYTSYTWTDVASVDEHDGSGPALFVAGGFSQAGGVPSQAIARYSSCGGPVSLFCFGDGSAAACPCGNASPVGADAGCLNSVGTGATLRVSGQAKLTHDTLQLEGGGMPDSSALYFQAGNVAVGGTGFAFGDGVKCTAGPFVRLGTKQNAGGSSMYPEGGNLPISVKGFIAAPGTRHYQIHYRNAAAFCTPATFNQSNAATVQWAP